MVAAWIRAETGVGPSIASGNHTCKGNCALFPPPPEKAHPPRRGKERPADKPGLGRLGDTIEGRRPRRPPEDDDPNKQRRVAYPRDDKGLLRGVAGRGLLEPVPDQE